MDDSWDWVYEIIDKPLEVKPELPEDALLFFKKKSPMVQVLIDRFDLDMEL